MTLHVMRILDIEFFFFQTKKTVRFYLIKIKKKKKTPSEGGLVLNPNRPTINKHKQDIRFDQTKQCNVP